MAAVGKIQLDAGSALCEQGAVLSPPRSADHEVKRYTARRACCRLFQSVITVFWVLQIYQRGLLEVMQLVDQREHCMATWQYI